MKENLLNYSEYRRVRERMRLEVYASRTLLELGLSASIRLQEGRSYEEICAELNKNEAIVQRALNRFVDWQKEWTLNEHRRVTW